jgi:hypothetical protein
MRDKHVFRFTAGQIAAAAKAEAQYHRDRIAFYQGEYAGAVSRLKDTARVEFREFEVTGGKRTDLVVNYGDPAAYNRMQEAYGKMTEHRRAAEMLESDAMLYATQPPVHMYDLDVSDVAYYRLGGQARPE